jgi:hypothetical protein
MRTSNRRALRVLRPWFGLRLTPHTASLGEALTDLYSNVCDRRHHAFPLILRWAVLFVRLWMPSLVCGEARATWWIVWRSVVLPMPVRPNPQMESHGAKMVVHLGVLGGFVACGRACLHSLQSGARSANR